MFLSNCTHFFQIRGFLVWFLAENAKGGGACLPFSGTADVAEARGRRTQYVNAK